MRARQHVPATAPFYHSYCCSWILLGLFCIFWSLLNPLYSASGAWPEDVHKLLEDGAKSWQWSAVYLRLYSLSSDLCRRYLQQECLACSTSDRPLAAPSYIGSSVWYIGTSSSSFQGTSYSRRFRLSGRLTSFVDDKMGRAFMELSLGVIIFAVFI